MLTTIDPLLTPDLPGVDTTAALRSILTGDDGEHADPVVRCPVR